MKLILAILFAMFAVCAALTIFFQIRYGHLTGPNSETAKCGTPSSAAIKCRRQAVLCSILAAFFLIAACAVGAVVRT
ncbi:MAG: hypothetical protein Q4A63_06555 [Butyricicoccus pullicaecorum]|nr:hypothetical protein [Butyricicoccus pullicaecorum]MDO4669460.1 hypothetical protein [Butyricicoccus pullicaecorum]